VRVLGAIGGLLGVVGVVAVFALVNGGYVYRVECPRSGGSTETEWTYRWQSVIPYIGYDRSGCETHSGTRVALDAVGVWKLGGDSGGSGQADHSSEYSRESVAAFVDGCVAQGESRSFCECTANEITIRLSPTELQRVALAMQGGATKFDQLPEDIRSKTRDAASAAEKDCR
jgi:hypothetical protein